MAAFSSPDLPRIAVKKEPGAKRTVDSYGNPVEEYQAVFPKGYTTIFVDDLTEIPKDAAGVRVTCDVKHQPVPKATDYILIDCFDQDHVRIDIDQVNRMTTVIIVAIDWERKALKFASDSNPADIAKFKEADQVYMKVLAFQKMEQRHQVPSKGQMLRAIYTQVSDVPERTFSHSFSTNNLNGTFWKVDQEWIYLNSEPWEDFRTKILGNVLDPVADCMFALSLHQYGGVYVYPKTWAHPVSEGVLDLPLAVCSEEDWAQQRFRPSPPTQLRPGTRFVRLGFLINVWNGDPTRKPAAEGWTEGAAPFLWRNATIVPY